MEVLGRKVGSSGGKSHEYRRRPSAQHYGPVLVFAGQ